MNNSLIFSIGAGEKDWTTQTSPFFSSSQAEINISPSNKEPQSEGLIPPFLIADRIFFDMYKLGFVDSDGNIQDSKFSYHSLPDLNVIHNIRLKAYLEQELDIQHDDPPTLLGFLDLILMEVKNLDLEIEDLFFHGWGAWKLLERFGYVADLLDNLDREILKKTPSFSDHCALSHLEIIVSIKELDCLALLKNGLNYEFRNKLYCLNGNPDILFTEYSALSIPLKIKKGESIVLRVISSKTLEKQTFPNPIAFSAKHLFCQNTLKSKMLYKEGKGWQTLINCIIGSVGINPCLNNKIQDPWMAMIRNVTRGCRLISSKLEKTNCEICKSFVNSNDFLEQITKMMRVSFEEEKPQNINELYAVAFQICSLITQDDEKRKHIWMATQELVKKITKDSGEERTQLLASVANLITQDGVPFSVIYAFLSLFGYIHQYTQDSNSNESFPINFRLTRWESRLALRVSFTSEFNKIFYIYIDLPSPSSLSSLYKSVLNLEEDVQKKLFSFCLMMLPLNPIEQAGKLLTFSWLSQTSLHYNPETDAYAMLHTKQDFIQYLGLCLFCILDIQRNQFTSFSLLLEYLSGILKGSISRSSLIFLLRSLDQLFFKYYSFEKCLENSFEKILNDDRRSEREIFLTLIENFSKIKDPKILFLLKNQWSKEFNQFNEWDQEITQSGISLLKCLIQACLFQESLGIFDSLIKKANLQKTQEMSLLIKICQGIKNRPDSSEISVCYLQLGLQAKLILKNSISNEFFQANLPNPILWIIQKLLFLSQIPLVAEILAFADEKSIFIEGRSIQNILEEWKTLSQYGEYFDLLIEQLKLSKTPLGNKLVDIEIAPINGLLSSSELNKILDYLHLQKNILSPRQKATIFCKLATHFLTSDPNPNKGQYWIHELFKMKEEIFWDDNTEKEIHGSFQLCCSHLQNFGVVTKLVDILTLSNDPKKVTDILTKAYQTFFNNKGYFNCLKVLILAKKKFTFLGEISQFQINAEQLINLLFENKNIKESSYTDCLELLKIYKISDGKAWLGALSYGNRFNRSVKRYLFRLWKTADLNSTLIYVDQKRKQCWQAAFLLLKDLPLSDILDLFNQRDRIKEVFNKPHYAYYTLLKETIQALYRALPGKPSSILLYSLLELRKNYYTSLKFFIDIDLPLLFLLNTNKEFYHISLNIFEENILGFSEPKLYPDFGIMFLGFLSKHKSNENSKEFDAKLVTIATLLRKKSLDNCLDYFSCAQRLSQIPCKEAISESLLWVLDGLKLYSPIEHKKQSLVINKEIYSTLERSISFILQIDLELLFSCLTHPNISLLSEEDLSCLWGKMISTSLTESLQDCKFKPELYINLCKTSLKQIHKLALNQALFFHCFQLIIQVNLRFLQNYHDIDVFEELQKEALTILTNEGSKSSNSLFKFKGTFVVVSEYLQFINTNNLLVSQLYSFCHSLLKELDFTSYPHDELDKLKKLLRLFFQWDSLEKNKSIFKQHLPFIFSLCNQTIKHLPGALAKKLIPIVFKQLFRLLDKYPEELIIAKDCYEEIKNIFENLLVKNILPKKVFENILQKVVLLAPFAFECYIQGEAINEYTAGFKAWEDPLGFTWLLSSIKIAGKKEILSTSSLHILCLYLTTITPTDTNGLLRLFQALEANPTYYSVVRMIQILKDFQVKLGIENSKKLFDVVLKVIEKLPKQLKTTLLLIQIFSSAVTLTIQFRKSPGYPSTLPLFSLLAKQMVKLCIHNTNDISKKEYFIQEILSTVICLESLCEKGFYNEDWESLHDILEFIRSQLLSIKFPFVTLTPIIKLLAHKYNFPLKNPDHQAERLKFFIECLFYERHILRNCNVRDEASVSSSNIYDGDLFDVLLESFKKTSGNKDS